MALRDIDLPPNTDKSKKDNEKRLKERIDIENRPIKDHGVKKKEKGMIETLVSEFIVDDISSVKKNVIEDTVKPWIKSGIYNIFDDTIRQLLGEPRGGRGGSIGRSTLTDYRGRSNGSSSTGVNNRSTGIDSNNTNRNRNSSGRFNSLDYPVKTRGQAEEALETLRGDIEEYGRATVAAFLKEVGETPTWNDNDYGWTNLNPDVCYIRSCLDGFVLVLPSPKLVRY